MNPDVQRQLMYLFERVTEPLYYGPKGNGESATFFFVPTDSLTEEQKRAAIELRRKMASIAKGKQLNIQAPKNIPDLTQIGKYCPKNAQFCYFSPNHQRALTLFRKILIDQRSINDFIGMAAICRDSKMMNPTLFIYGFASAIVQRPDLKGFQMPPIYEIMPNLFFDAVTMKAAERSAGMPATTRTVIAVPDTITNNMTNNEHKLAYFREDMGINAHHFHWHVVYMGDYGPGIRDRKGELFYYMHHSMLARYDAERLSNGMARVKPLNIDEPLAEGYFSKLTSANSGRAFGNRQENTELVDIDRSNDSNNRSVLLKEEMKRWRDRLIEAIDTSSVLLANGSRAPLEPLKGIETLGDLIENGRNLGHNYGYYGDFGIHNMGHILIAHANDPKYLHRENPGPMGDTTTAMRDPSFYRWHKYIDKIFDHFKTKSTALNRPYYLTESGDLSLEWQGISLTKLSVKTPSRRNNPNVMFTYWMHSDVDLFRGLDFQRTSESQIGAIWARVLHLNHEDFEYDFEVDNKTGRTVNGTVRIFIAPRFNENGERITLSQQRNLYFELDKFTQSLNPGLNKYKRLSTQSSVTVPWHKTFEEIERSPQVKAGEGICGCGWPHHMLLPRGSPEGMPFDLFMIITDSSKDAVGSTRGNNSCSDAISFCGVLNSAYPDRKPMGYPFDRPFRPVRVGYQWGAIDYIERLMNPNTNGRAIEVKILNLTRQPRVRETDQRHGNPTQTTTMSIQICANGTQRSGNNVTTRNASEFNDYDSEEYESEERERRSVESPDWTNVGEKDSPGSDWTFPDHN